MKVFLWGSAADKTGEDPYKTMNTWFTTNKAAIDAASLASAAQVGPWGLYIDLQRNIADTNLRAEAPAAATPIAAATVCYVNTSVLQTFNASALYFPAVGGFGSSFGIGIQNKTTTAKTPFLMWGARTTTLTTVSVSGAAAIVWDSYAWTPNTSITDYNVAIPTATQTTLSGVDSTAAAQTTMVSA